MADYGSRYSGSSNDGKNFAYAMYREDMKAVGLNPDCNIENDIQQEGKMGDQRYTRTTNPYLSQCRNDNHAWLQGGKVVLITIQQWKEQICLNIIGTGGCRSRAIPCTELRVC